MAWTEKLKSGRYRGGYRDASGAKRYLGRTYTQRAEAKRLAAIEEDKIRRPGAVDPKAGRATWGQWREEWFPARRIESGTARGDESRMRTHVAPYWDEVPLADITRERVQQWIDELSRTSKTAPTKRGSGKAVGGGQRRKESGKALSPTTVKKVYRLFAKSLADAVVAGKIGSSPCVDIELPKAAPPDEFFLTREQFARLRSAADDELLRMILDLGVGTGMRWGEIVGLHRSRVDIGQRRIVVQEVYELGADHIKPYPKGKSRRGIPITDELAAALDEWMAAHPAVRCRAQHRDKKRCDGALLLPSKAGTPIGYSNFRRDRWNPAVQEAALDGLTPHDLRHTYASWLLQRGVTIEQVSELLGHSTITMTQRYAHLADTQWDAVRGALSGAGFEGARHSHHGGAPHLPHVADDADHGKVVDLASRRRSTG
ncbi:Site-specific recombinase XerD [Actinopolyspora xinjiangensis]|uniref:Site-specific recombinase XerD n=1 Tax=Actinopolyspora xinjiangensis TaxID=405564 RepID=A0A1H0U5K1_9ACTN|nr:site-specific integrase [Actinopolyspora xinjiangensis]SDP61421.1 Site-specific recombinase XerD [Actinopolyspora xinjiangensis]